MSPIPSRCQACGNLVRGSVLVGRKGDGKFVGECCAAASDLALLRSMIPDDAPTPKTEFSLVAHNPLGYTGQTQYGAWVVEAIREKWRNAAPEDKHRYSQAFPEAAEEVLREREEQSARR